MPAAGPDSLALFLPTPTLAAWPSFLGTVMVHLETAAGLKETHQLSGPGEHSDRLGSGKRAEIIPVIKSLLWGPGAFPVLSGWG